VQVKRTQRGHIPNYFGQHTEGDYNLQICFPTAQVFQECFFFQPFRLKQGQVVRQCVLLYGGVLDFVSSSGRFIGHGYYSGYVIAAFDQPPQRLDGKVGRTHIYYSQSLFHKSTGCRFSY
jgi:hypothetical protein